MNTTTRHSLPAVLAAALLLTGVCVYDSSAEEARITVDAGKPGHAVAPTLWGIFFEDINLSADGGIYPELVRNRSFEDSEKPEFWELTAAEGGKSAISIDAQTPLNPLNRRSLRVRLDGKASLVNSGYWGMSVVEGEHYRFRLAARCADGFHGPLEVLVQRQDGSELAKGSITGLTDKWQYFPLDLVALATEPKARLAITASGQGTFWLDMVSLMPAKTWKNHGLRPDLCEMLAGLKPAFVRFPGGCWVEGDDMAHMYHWKETIGDIAHRKPLGNIWGYHATHGLGFHEYLQLSEDLGAEPLFCINVGMSHHENVPLDQMGQWVQDALDAVEYANGPVDSVWGGLRAKNGHPAPFGLKYLEIGNENGGPAYFERWELLARALKARYPTIQLIANVWGDTPKQPGPDIVDEHYYSNPEFFMQQAHRYDKYDRKGPKVFIGEYAVTEGCGNGNLRGAIGEAAFMTGIERNSDMVVMASYAPLFVNVNHRKWNPDLINFDSSRVYGLPSYYVQKLFADNRGDVVLPVALDQSAADAPPIAGAIGVGTWATRAEFKDIKVTRGDQTLFASDFQKGTDGWRLLGGEWKVQDAALRQSALNENIRAIAGDKNWSNYTLSLKARKISGAEGFLILFGVQDDGAKSWWNIGGWGNQRHGVEMGGIVGNQVNGGVEAGRWYDIRVELKGSNVKCYLDGKLMHDVDRPTVKTLYASATRDQSAGEIILKIVNTAAGPQSAEIKLEGVAKLLAARAVVLASSKPEDENSLDNPRKVAPVTSTLNVSGSGLQQALPGNSLTVLRLKSE